MIEWQVFRFPIQFTARMAWFYPCHLRRLSHEALLPGSVTITVRFDPHRNFRCTAKRFASASVHLQLGLTRVSMNLNRKARSSIECNSLARFYPHRSLHRRQSLRFSVQLARKRLGFTLPSSFELTREVVLPDQSGSILRARKNIGKCYFTKILWKYVDACARNLS